MTNAPDSNVAALPKPKAPSLPVTVDVNNPTSLYLDTAVFEQIQRVAVMMSKAGLAPKHLQGPEKVADCILVVAQALRWKSDPFAVAQHTFVLQGKLGYEGKLIAAMVNASGKLKENLNYEYSGYGDARQIVVSGTLKGSDALRKIDGTVAKWKTGNEFWKKNPDQMLAYRGAREWARRHMPEVLLGVNSEEEVSPRTMVDVTPSNNAAALNQALANAAPPSPADDMRVVDGEVVDGTTGEILDADEQVATAGEGAEADRSKMDNIIAGLEEMTTAADFAEYVSNEGIKKDIAAMPDDQRARWATAKATREKALAKMEARK